MKLHSTPTQHYQTVTGYEDDWIEINALRFSHSLIVMPEVAPSPWSAASFDDLQPDDFEPIVAMAPDLLILGTGKRQRFPNASMLANLLSRRIGVECMDNQAACRTYNILMAEGRKVALAVILPRKQTM